MDRAELSEAIIAELGELFVREVRRVGPELVVSDLDGIEQQLQDLSRRVCGRVVERTIAAIAAAQPSAPPVCAGCQQPMRLVDLARERALQGLVGDYTLHRAYFGCAGCHVGAAPLDERLGLGRGMLSPGLGRVACRAGIEEAFLPAADLLGELLRIDVAEEAVRRITEGIGAVAEAEQQAAMTAAAAGQAPKPEAGEAPPTALLVEVDGVQVPVERGWNEMKVGVVAPLGPTTETDPESGRVRLAVGAQSACAGFEPAATFWYRVYAEACRRGLGRPSLSLLVLLGDGAEWIWHYGRQFLALKGVELVEIVDLYHAIEHLWTVAHAVFGASSPKAVAWVEPLKRALQTDGAGPVLAALEALAPEAETVAAAEEVRKARGYFTANAARMDYPRFLARQLPIGSGAVECACKTLVQARAKQAGMRWRRAGVQAVVSLRALHRSGRWERFWQTRPQRRRPAVVPRRPTSLATAPAALHPAA
jgi:hypothetical protein